MVLFTLANGGIFLQRAGAPPALATRAVPVDRQVELKPEQIR